MRTRTIVVVVCFEQIPVAIKVLEVEISQIA
jgi:hypothetical protein